MILNTSPAPEKEFSATDVVERIFACTCGKSECTARMLRPLRQHIATLFRAIISAGHNELLPGYEGRDEPWPGTIYALQMAAGIEDVIAHPAFSDDSEAGLWCSSAWESDLQDAKEASQYAAGLVIFNFIWMAYEAATREIDPERYARDKQPVRARKIFVDEQSALGIPKGLEQLYRICEKYCLECSAMITDVSNIRRVYNLDGLAASAELMRIFRNYIVHGDDQIPIYGRSSSWSLIRFYSATKVILLLIQSLVTLKLSSPDTRIQLSVNGDEDDTERASWIFMNLHLNDTLWRGTDYDLFKR